MKKYYLGLDIGTDSIGYAVTDEQYNILKFHGTPAWGSHIFDAASLNDDRRMFRTGRRRLDRRQQRITLLQELFAKEIAKTDERFFIRLQESNLYREDTDGDSFTLFNDSDFTDADYYSKYPTIHHLILDLMDNKNPPYDVRLVYLACAWLIAHRGHFLSNISLDNISSLKDFKSVYADFQAFFIDNGFDFPWDTCEIDELGHIIKKKCNITEKKKEIIALLYNGAKPSKESREDFPFSEDSIISLISGGTCNISDLFINEEYAQYGKVSLGMDDDKLNEIASEVGDDDFSLIEALRKIADWAVLVDILGSYKSISEAKVNVYNQHKNDLKLLKYFVRKYIPQKYGEVFRDTDKANYAGYSYHSDEENLSKFKKKNLDDFSGFILALFKDITPDETDKNDFDNMNSRLKERLFMPKQKTTDNRVIPNQLYLSELKTILENASAYLSFLNTADDKGLTVKHKIISIFSFRIPYFVGPLNASSEHAWIERKAGKIYPWNFDEMVDLDATEQKFIQKMTNHCTYLPGEPVLPKDSLCYHKFMVLDEINNLKINGKKISVELKQKIYKEKFLIKKKVTKKSLIEYLIANGYIGKGEENLVTGIDDEIKSNLVPQIAFKSLLDNGTLSEDDVEKIIERSSYSDDKSRLNEWLIKNYPSISNDDRKYICRLKIKDFGRLSKEFLCKIEGICKETGECMTILGALWNTENNLMELLSSKFTFAEKIDEIRNEYFCVNKISFEDKLNDMYISNAVKRPIYRTFDIVKDVERAFGKPEKIFIEVTRGSDDSKKGKRTKTRKQQIYELYAKCKDEDVRLLKQQLESMGEKADNMLQGDKLFLYYMQMGKSMYSDTPIDLDRLGTKEYDIDHIYPQAFVKDDSIINNKVLVLSSENGAKSDIYPINSSVRQSQRGFWNYLHDRNLVSDEKYKRLVRSTPFTDEEKYGFISRQLTETSQATKAVATLLKEKYPDAQIVYSRAKLVSEFRQEFDLLKSRSVNDLHHAIDAYLNIVTGNVYDMKFSQKWFNVNSNYSIKTKTIFTHQLVINDNVIWDGENSLALVKKTATKNTANFTKYTYLKKGQLFDIQPEKASEGLVPLKKNLPSIKYGGYNSSKCMFFIPVKYVIGKKTDCMIMSVEVMYGDQFLTGKDYAEKYAFKRLEHILGKSVDSVSFPMGIRPWKINTILSLDGFLVSLTGSSSKGKSIIAQPIVQFSSSSFWNYYIKKLNVFYAKIEDNPKYIYDEAFDKISKDKNLELYNLYMDKLENSIYKKRINSPISILKDGVGKFSNLSIKEQVLVLTNVQMIFCRTSSSGVDLTLINGKKSSAATKNFSSTISNWSNKYSDVRLIDVSASGLWMKKSENLLSIL